MTAIKPIDQLKKMIKSKMNYQDITNYYLNEVKPLNNDTELYQYVNEDGFVIRDIVISDTVYTIMKTHYTIPFNIKERLQTSNYP